MFLVKDFFCEIVLVTTRSLFGDKASLLILKSPVMNRQKQQSFCMLHNRLLAITKSLIWDSQKRLISSFLFIQQVKIHIYFSKILTN